MTQALPTHSVATVPEQWLRVADPADWPWHELPPLPAFQRADGSGPALQQTTVRLCRHQALLYVRFDCEDRDIWGTYTQRDDPIYDEEVVELFLAPGTPDPERYIELEVSPNGVLLDAEVYNPGHGRATIQVDFEWSYDGLQWQVGRDDAQNHWWAQLILPLSALVADDEIAHDWRANFYRIERPRDGDDEFSCWSPTLTTPADFHRPQRFGYLLL